MKPYGRYDLRSLLAANVVDSDGKWRLTVARIAVSYLVPCALGAGLGLWVKAGLPVQNGVAVALPSASLLVGAMFGAFVFLTNLRVKLSESDKYAFRADLQRSVGQGAAACLYVALASMVLAGALGLTGSLPWLRSPEVAPYTVGMLVALAIHIGFTVALVVSRLFRIYLDMFAADFDPTVRHGEALDGVTPIRPKPLEITPTRRSKRMLGRR